MSREFVAAPGEIVLVTDLAAPKGRDLAERLSGDTIPFAALVECRRTATFDVVVLDIETEVPQIREHDIRSLERLAVCFDHADARMPDVLALREDFPATAHLYPPVDAVPKHLCLFEEEYADLRRRWTSPFFVRRVQDWLRLTARGELHAQDQPLEQALAGSGHRIILPHQLSKVSDCGSTGDIVPIKITAVDEYRGSFVILTAIAGGVNDQIAGRYAAMSFTSAPHGPGTIASTPGSISELHAFLARSGDDLVDVLRRRLVYWPRQPEALASQLILIVRIPKRRDAAAQVENLETWAFLGPSVRDIGVALGIWEPTPAGIALMIPLRRELCGESAPLDALSVHFRISREEAALLNASNVDDRRIVAIGAGALGSQVILNCARAAFGRWTVIDRDRLLPHNVARHALGEFGIGHHKALVLASVANRLTDDEDVFEPIVADVLSPGPEGAIIDARLGNADVVVDLAASVPVARYLAHEAPGSARRISMFLNPVGSDLVILAEDKARQTRLDMLEMQYYRAVLREPRLQHHLRRPEERVRYGRSCRDVSFRLPQAAVALHAATATRQLRVAADDDAPAIKIWRTDESSLGVTPVTIDVSQITSRALGAWTVQYDKQLLDTIQRLRGQRLPNETGGVLLGSFDIERRLIYVVDTIPSPADSKERHTLYIRGHEGLQQELEVARQQTFQQLEYVGEWHSHPNGIDCRPSGDDLEVLRWLTTHMDADGVPGVMMIGCENDQLAILLAQVIGS